MYCAFEIRESQILMDRSKLPAGALNNAVVLV